MDITGIGSLFDFGSKVIDKIFPDKDAANQAKLKMIELQQAGEFKQLETEMAIAQGQMAINAEEAKSPDFFRGGWRPAVGWVCAMGCAWNWIGLPVAKLTADLLGSHISVSPADLSEMLPNLMGMLGLGGLRTVERLKGKA
jgi:hypothetical protein